MQASKGSAKKLKKLREELYPIQKDVVDKARITESTYCANELSDRNLKPKILDRIAKVLGMRSECLNAPAFRNRREFAYALLENEDIFGYTVRSIDGAAAITTRYGSTSNFFADFIHNWEGMRKKLNDHGVIKEEYEDRKRA